MNEQLEFNRELPNSDLARLAAIWAGDTSYRQQQERARIEAIIAANCKEFEAREQRKKERVSKRLKTQRRKQAEKKAALMVEIQRVREIPLYRRTVAESQFLVRAVRAGVISNCGYCARKTGQNEQRHAEGTERAKKRAQSASRA